MASWPDVPIRQYVLTLPFRLRFLIAFDRKLCSEVLGVYARTLFNDYRHRARRRGLRDAVSVTLLVLVDLGAGRRRRESQRQRNERSERNKHNRAERRLWHASPRYRRVTALREMSHNSTSLDYRSERSRGPDSARLGWERSNRCAAVLSGPNQPNRDFCVRVDDLSLPERPTGQPQQVCSPATTS